MPITTITIVLLSGALLLALWRLDRAHHKLRLSILERKVYEHNASSLGAEVGDLRRLVAEHANLRQEHFTLQHDRNVLHADEFMQKYFHRR